VPTAAAAKPPTLWHVRVLVVDACERVRARLRGRLHAAGASVLEAATLHDALAMVVEFRTDAILLDIHLDASTGIDGLVELRRAAPGATIAVLTNEANEIHRQECIRRGADLFFDKSSEFDQAVESVLARA
jgi:DNA-binding response OmpR family regulator